MKESISVVEARETILESIRPMGAERVPVSESLGRVLAENVDSRWNLPPLDNSAMDGFAVRSADLEQASTEHPVLLRVLEDVRAGQLPSESLVAGTAIRIMTGAPMPEGADAVVKVEDTVSEGESVSFSAPVQPGEHVRKAGEDVATGARVLLEGTVMTPAVIAMAASLGRASVRVVQRPRVAVLCTGDELIEVDGERRGGRFVASNLYSLEAQVRECGATPVVLGIARDRVESIERKLLEASGCDVIVSTGGVSVGDYDLVKEVLERIGTEMVLWRVAMKPGHPLAFGRLNDKPVFGLPGNPVSAMVSFEQFVRPALLRMMGHQRIARPVVRARLEEPLKQKPGRTGFMRAVVSLSNDGFSVRTTGHQSSGMLGSMVAANALLVMPAEVSALEAGELVDVQLTDAGFLSAS